MDKTTQERIKADAEAYIEEKGTAYAYGYIAGATAWAQWKVKHEELLAQTNLSLAIQRQCTTDAQNRCERMIRQRNDMQSMAQRMADALEEIAEGSHDYESTNYAKRLHMPNCRACKAKEVLQQFKDGGKEDKVYRPCPHCSKELFRDRNLCCRACGKEVKNDLH